MENGRRFMGFMSEKMIYYLLEKGDVNGQGISNKNSREH